MRNSVAREFPHHYSDDILDRPQHPRDSLQDVCTVYSSEVSLLLGNAEMRRRIVLMRVLLKIRCGSANYLKVMII